METQLDIISIDLCDLKPLMTLLPLGFQDLKKKKSHLNLQPGVEDKKLSFSPTTKSIYYNTIFCFNNSYRTSFFVLCTAIVLEFEEIQAHSTININYEQTDKVQIKFSGKVQRL